MEQTLQRGGKAIVFVDTIQAIEHLGLARVRVRLRLRVRVTLTLTLHHPGDQAPGPAVARVDYPWWDAGG